MCSLVFRFQLKVCAKASPQKYKRRHQNRKVGMVSFSRSQIIIFILREAKTEKKKKKHNNNLHRRNWELT